MGTESVEIKHNQDTLILKNSNTNRLKAYHGAEGTVNGKAQGKNKTNTAPYKTLEHRASLKLANTYHQNKLGLKA